MTPHSILLLSLPPHRSSSPPAAWVQSAPFHPSPALPSPSANPALPSSSHIHSLSTSHCCCGRATSPSPASLLWLPHGSLAAALTTTSSSPGQTQVRRWHSSPVARAFPSPLLGAASRTPLFSTAFFHPQLTATPHSPAPPTGTEPQSLPQEACRAGRLQDGDRTLQPCGGRPLPRPPWSCPRC